MHSGVRLVALTVLLAGIVALWYTIDSGDQFERQLWGLSQTHRFELREKLKARPDPQIDAMHAFMARDFAETPEVAPKGGWYEEPVRVTLRTSADQTIRYTLDGSIPTQRSTRYEEPIEIAATTVVRYRAFGYRKFGSDTKSHTYFVGEKGSLPRVSLVVDPIALWNKYSGIYDNYWGRGRAWERPAEIEYYRRDGKSLFLPVRIRIHGGTSRRMDKKPFRVYFNAGDVTGDAHSRILSVRSGKATCVLRQGGSNREFRLRDELFSILFEGIGGHVSHHETVVLYLAGKYWGIYNLRELIDETYLRDRFGPGDYDMVRVNRVVLGKKTEYERLERAFSEMPLDTDAGLRDLGELIELDAFTDYWLMNIYACNNDWPHNNALYARRRGDANRWTPLTWDTDNAFKTDQQQWRHDTLAWATRDSLRHDLRDNHHLGLTDGAFRIEATFWLRRVLRNDGYRRRFITRMCDLLNHALRADRIEPVLDRLLDAVKDDVDRDLAHWPWADRLQYDQHIQKIRDFARNRPAFLRGCFQRKFRLGDSLPLEVAREGEGTVRVNGLAAGESWRGEYFAGLTVRLEAAPKEGWRFAGWTPVSLGNAPAVAVEMRPGLRVTARFVRE